MAINWAQFGVDNYNAKIASTNQRMKSKMRLDVKMQMTATEHKHDAMLNTQRMRISIRI